MPQKIRLDILMVDQGLASSRARAKALIMSGLVSLGTQTVDKPGFLVNPSENVKIKKPDHPWVSRGGLKLSHGIKYFNLKVRGKLCADIGASTGGFTDVLLNNNAKKVYAIDVGRGQLAWTLRNDKRVVVLERTNARYLSCVHIPEPLDIIVCDVSFISLTKILTAPMSLARPGAHLIALIKPQFELQKNQVGKGGIVRDHELHLLSCNKIKDWLHQQEGWRIIGIEKSPIEGQRGNIEFLICARKDSEEQGVN